MMKIARRTFLYQSSAVAAGLAVGAQTLAAKAEDKAPLFKISLAQWSLHKTLFSGKLNNLDFAKVAKNDYGIDAVEYVNQFFPTKAQDPKYLGDMKTRAADLGVTNVLIMIDGEGQIWRHRQCQADRGRGEPLQMGGSGQVPGLPLDSRKRLFQGDPRGAGQTGDRRPATAQRVCRRPHGINIIVENHGGLSSNGEWLAGVMKMVDLDNCGTLPDFGNFGKYDPTRASRS